MLSSPSRREPALAALARRARITALALCAVAALGACGDDDDDDDDLTGPGANVPAGRTIYGLDLNNNLVAFGAQNPTTTAARTVAITGLNANERVVGIDFRANAATAADRRLFGVTTASRVVTIDTTTGTAAVVGSAAFIPAVEGTAFGIDFNPTVSLIRLHSDRDQDLRINPATNPVAVTPDSVLAYALNDTRVGQNPNIVGSAYTNSVPGVTGAANTELFAIDSDRDELVFLPMPNNGRLTTRGQLGVNTTQDVGFDIYGPGLAGTVTSQAYVTLTPEGSSRSRLYTINLTSGATTLIGDVNYNRSLIGIAVTP
jgi:hypothetical protein